MSKELLNQIQKSKVVHVIHISIEAYRALTEAGYVVVFVNRKESI